MRPLLLLSMTAWSAVTATLASWLEKSRIGSQMKRNLAVSQPLGIDQVLHRKPGYLIRRLQQMAVSIFFDETSEFDITPAQLGTLLAVSVFPGIDQFRVANAIGFDRTTISGVVDRLEARKLLVRQQCGTDRRANLLFATSEGHQLLADAEDATNRVQDRILAPLSANERKLFLEYLDRLVVYHNHSSRVPMDKALIPKQPSPSTTKRRRSRTSSL